METDRETLDLDSEAAAAAFRSAKITAGVVSWSRSKSAELADFESDRFTEAFLRGGWLTGGGGGAVGGLGGFAAGAGRLPGSTVTRVAGLAYKFPLS